MSQAKDKLDLDFDDGLEEERDIFGIAAQLVKERVTPPTLTKQVATTPKATDWKRQIPLQITIPEAVFVAQQVYGLTNSAAAEEFYQWAVQYLTGQMELSQFSKDMQHTVAVQNALKKERNYWLPRACMVTQGGEFLAKRHEAVLCALLSVRAVLARPGLETKWIERCLYRAGKSIGDIKTEGYGRGRGTQGAMRFITPPK